MSNLKLFSSNSLNIASTISLNELSKTNELNEGKFKKEIEVQTNELNETFSSTQTNFSSLNLNEDLERKSIPIQTESEISMVKAWAKDQTQESKLSSRKSLYKFLNQSNAVKEMANLINNNLIISPNYYVNWDEEINDIALIHSFRHDQLKVGCMAWNDLGHLAVSYEPKNPPIGWCMDSGLIVIKRSFNSKNSSKYTLTIDVPESIVTCMDFYPGRGNILAVGTYDGTVKSYKLSSENEKLLCESKVHELYSHKDPICQVQWLKASADRSIVLGAMSTEGRFSIWTVKNDFLQPIAIYMITDVERGGINLGITSFSFSNIHAGISIRSMSKQSIIPTTDNYFIFGTEVGKVGKSILSGGKILESKSFAKGNVSTPETKSKNIGTIFEYDSGFGFLHKVECSPFHKNLFLTISSEGLVRIYNVYLSQDIITLQPFDSMLFDAQWSPFRPCVLATGGENGILYIYDFVKSIVTPIISISVGSARITQIKFDPENSDIISTGDSEGNCKIWRLPNKLSSLHPHEMAILRSISKEDGA